MTDRRRSVLRHRQFAAFFIAASISNAASWMQLVAVPALLYDLTGKAQWLGISTIAGMLPAVLLTPWAGVLSDRISRRLILVVTQSVAMVATFTLWGLYAAGHIGPVTIVFIGFVNGIATGFQTSTWQAFVPSLVPPEDMLDAVRLNSTQFTVARVVGPATAGIVVAAFGVGAAIFLNASTFLLVIGVLVVVRPNPQILAERTNSFHAFVEGARYVRRHPAVRLAVLITFFTAITGQSLQYVAAAVAGNGFGRKTTDSAALLTSLGIGAFLASLIAGPAAIRFSREVMMVFALTLYAVAPVVVAATRAFPVAVAGYFIAGIAHLTIAVQVNSLIQIDTPDQLRGRVMSFYLLGILGGIAVGPLALGSLMDAIGVHAALVADAGLIVVVGASLVASGRLSVFSS